MIDDHITILNSRGERKQSFSILDCFLNSDYRSVLNNLLLEDHRGDAFHTNSIEIIKEGLEDTFHPFRAGSILISIRNLHTIAIIDPSSKKVTWALSGFWTHQHQPDILANGNILLFDNLGEMGKSKLIEFNPGTQKIVWAYRGNSENNFRTEDLGSQQRLPNGNTLITESRNGRVFEITPANEIVWEFITPQKTGPDNELIAAVYEMIRLEPEDLYFLVEGDKPGPVSIPR